MVDLPADQVQSKSQKRKRHRDEPDKAAWGRIVGNVPRYIMPGQRLPTNRVVMQRYHTMRAMCNNRTTIPEYAHQLYNEIFPIWGKASIPTVDQKICITRLSGLLSSWSKMRCREMKNCSEQERRYIISMLDSLFMMCDLDLEKV